MSGFIKKMFLWYALLLKRVFKNPVIVLILAGIPLTAAVLVNIPSFNQSDSARVGIVVSDSDELVNKVVESLINGNYPVRFYREESVDRLNEDIIKNRTVAGYVFSDNYTEKLDTGNYGKGILLIKKSSEYISSMTNEIVFAQLFRQYGGTIAASYVNESDIFASVRSEALKETEEKYDRYLNGNTTFSLKFESINVNIQEDSGILLFPIRGVMAVFIMAAGILGCVWYKLDEEKGVFAAMSKGVKKSGMALYNLALVFPAALSAEIVLIITGTGMYPYELVNMLIYIAAVTVSGMVLCMIIHGSRMMVSILPVVITFAIIFCPVFIDITTVIPKAGDIIRSLLLPYYYINGWG